MTARDMGSANERRERKTPLKKLFDADGRRRQRRRELQEQALRLLARARVERVPDGFDGSLLMHTIHSWRRELPELRTGPEPLKADKVALGEVSAAAKKLTTKLDRLAEAMAAPASRIADSRFNGPWPRERLVALRRELVKLSAVAGSRDVEEDMRRPDIVPGKPAGDWSAQEAFLGYDLPMLYRQMFPRRRFTVNGKEYADPSEGVRFACVVACEVLGYAVEPATIVKMSIPFRAAIQRRRPRTRAARGGERGPK